MGTRLYRSRDDRVLAGVAGGLAELWGADPSVVRIVWALLVILCDLTRRDYPLKDGQLFWVLAGTLFITSRFWTRDFDDGGQNLSLLALTWLAIWLFLLGWARIVSGTFTVTEIAMTIVVGAASTLGIVTGLRMKTATRTAVAAATVLGGRSST